jgi:VCBS repeat-containing protein
VNGTFTITDPDAGDTLTTSVVDTDVHGTITLGNGTFTYTPNAGFEGTDTFQIKVTDAAGLTDTQTVTVDVGPQVNEVSIDVGSQSTQATITLDEEANILTEDDSATTNVIIFNFDADDVIQSTGDPSDYSFARQGNNLEIQNNNDGKVNTIIIAGVVNSGFVFDLETAIDAVGHNFITFG